MRVKRVFVLAAAWCLVMCGNAHAGDPVVDGMGEAFVSALPANVLAERGQWEFLDVIDCYTNGDSCFGNNPSSPYGYTKFRGSVSMKLGPSEAVVVFMRTPPQARYFGFTQYLVRRGRSPQVLASLSDSLNLLNFWTLQSSAPGENVFNQYAVLVWTADLNTLAMVKRQLAAQGVPDTKVNFMPIPIGLPLNLGYGPDDDSLSILLRTAIPNVQVEFDEYRLSNPFFAVKVVPIAPPTLSPAPIIGYKDEISGVSEVPTLSAPLNALVRDIKLKYARAYALRAQKVAYVSALGFECIQGTAVCTLDTHDGLYANDTTLLAYQPTNLNDIVVIAGVNHQRTGKALYVNHTVNDVAKQTGIVSVDDPALTTQSALYHAGVTSSTDPRVSLYDKLYAYVVSYDCSGLQYCLQIPAPTPENPIGLQPGAKFGLYERSYVDPKTGVRPSQSEIVKHQVLIGTKKP